MTIMSPDNNNNKKQVGSAKDEKPRSTTGRKTTSTTKPNQDQEIPSVPLKCPRCDSPNTKFCYYNNYSLSQPRHFCKTCRRYWTRNGALRNVPIGGGCRKNKKLIKSSSSATTTSSSSRFNSKDSGTISTGLKFFEGLSPAMDFQLGGINNITNSPPNNFNQFVSSFGDHHIQSLNSHPPLMGFHQELGSSNVHSTIATTIESLSSMNQDLHWKLQQQRLSNMFFVGENINHHKENGTSTSTSNYVLQANNEPKPLQPILFQNLENISKPEDQQSNLSNGNGNNLCTEWYFDNSYAASMNPTPETSSSNNNIIINNNNNTSSSWSTGIQAWSDLTNYNALP